MTPLYIQELYQDNFRKKLDFLSPGDSTYFIFLVREVDSIILSKNHIFHIESCLLEDGGSGYLELLYHVSWEILEA